MMRFPDVSGEKIVFVYGEDLWLVPREGGVAQPLASPAGEESLPRFSADGQTIAFVGNYDGNSDIYTIPTAGGVAERVTWSGASELLTDWTATGELIFSTNAYVGLERQTQLLVVKPNGSGERELPVPYGSNGVLSSDGQWLAYTPYNADYRTW
jgi:tricorn protease